MPNGKLTTLEPIIAGKKKPDRIAEIEKQLAGELPVPERIRFEEELAELEPELEPEEQVTVDELLGRIYEGYEPITLKFIKDWAVEQPEAFVEDIVKRGRTEDTEILLELLGATPEDLDVIFPPSVSILPQLEKPEWLTFDFWKDALFRPYVGKDLAGKAASSFVAGIGDVIKTSGGAASWLGYEEVGGVLNTIGSTLGQVAPPPTTGEFEMADMLNPEFYATKVTRTVPFALSLAPLAIGGFYGGTTAATALGLSTVWSWIIGGLAGAALSRPLESALEAGSQYDDAISRGRTPKEAKEEADEVFRKNMVLAGADAWEIAIALAPTPKWVPTALVNSALVRTTRIAGKMVIVGLSEGGEEVYQDMVQRHARGEEWQLDPVSKEVFAIGMAMGVGMGLGGDVISGIVDRSKGKMLPEVRTKYMQALSESIAKGFSTEESELRALDDIAQTPEGEKIVSESIKEAKEEITPIKPKEVTTEQLWESMEVEERVSWARMAGLEGRLGSKVWVDLAREEQDALLLAREEIAPPITPVVEVVTTIEEITDLKKTQGSLATISDIELRRQLGEGTEGWSQRVFDDIKQGKEITVFRVVPKGVKEIHIGDRVTHTRESAELIRKEMYLAEEADILSITVTPDELIPQIPNEFLYAPSKPPAVEEVPRVVEPAKAPMVEEQKTQLLGIGKEKLLIGKTGVPSGRYNQLLKVLFGKERLDELTLANEEISGLTEAEATEVLRVMSQLEPKFGKPPKIPTTEAELTDEFLAKIPQLREVGIIEKVRPTRQVFEKMGLRKEVFEPAFKAEIEVYEELQAFRKEANETEKLVGKNPERRMMVFRELENPGTIIGLTFNEKRAVTWFRKKFDEWADRLNIPQEKRLKNYVTHIFEEEVKQELDTKHPLDPEVIKSLDFITPKTIFNPYLQKRLGRKIGLKEDPFAAISAYEARALKVYHYEPLIQKIRVYTKYLPPNATRYLRNFITRITGRPLTIDSELNQTLKEFGDAIKTLPGGEQFATAISRGNVGGLASYQFTSALYFLWLGFKPTSAIRNLSQHTLALAEVGPINFAEGIGLRFTEEGKSALKESMVLRSRRQAFVPGIDASFASRWTDKFRETALWMFRQADRQNVSDSFLAGYAEMKRAFPEAGREWWIRRGDEVAGDTQYIYSQMGSAAWSQSAVGRTLSVLTTWPENWVELMTRFVKGRPSYVINEYCESVGKPVPKKNWLQTRKALLLYMGIVALGFLIKEETRLKAWEYTGLTSLRYLADLAGGEFPALQYPGAVMNVIVGFLTDDERRLKEGWSQLKPVNLMGIIRTLDDVMAGEKDWLTLLFYLEGQDWKIKKLKEDWKNELEEYPLFETDEEYNEWIRTHRKQAGWSQIKIRNQWREDNPKIEAKLFITNQFSALSTEAARQEVLRIIKEHELDTELIKGYDKVFPLDTSEELDEFTGRIGNLEKLEVGVEAEYFTTNDFATEVNKLVDKVGRTKIEQDGNPFAVEYLRAKDQWEAYEALEENAARILFRQQFPDVEASLYLFGKVQSFKNPKSSDILLDLMEKYGIPPEGIRAFLEKPERYDALFTREYILKKKWFDLTTEYENFSNTEATNYIEDKELRKEAREKFRSDNPTWMADMRRIEAIQHDASEDIVEGWAERGVVIDKFEAGSSEAMVWLVDNPKVHKWALEKELLGDDGKDWNIPVLRYNAKWRELDDKYLGYGDETTEFYIKNDEERQLARDKLLLNEEYRKDRRRREAHNDGFSESQIENFVKYHELPVKGYRQEQFLIDNLYFAREMHNIKGIDFPDPSKIPSPRYDDIYESRPLDFDKLWGLADSESEYYIENVERRKDARRSLLYDKEGNPTSLFRDSKRLEAYKLFIPENHIAAYVKMAVEPDKGFRDERYLKDNPSFYKDVWLGIMKNDRVDFSKVPHEEYDNLYDRFKTWFDEWDAYKDPDSPLYIDNAEERAKARDRLTLANPAFADAIIRRTGYKVLIGHEEHVDSYVTYYQLLTIGKPKDLDVWYEDDWFLIENDKFYKVLRRALSWELRDFTKVPTREVFRLYQIYRRLDKGKIRENYRARYPELDKWMVLAGKVSKTVEEQEELAELSRAERMALEIWEQERAREEARLEGRKTIEEMLTEMERKLRRLTK